MKKIRSNEKGQSTIEFIFTFAFGVSVILLIFNSALNYATGYLVHYATFMASRVYLTQDNSLGTFGTDQNNFQTSAAEAANTAFAKYNLGIFGVPSDGFKINHASSNMQSSEALMVGAYTTFNQRIDVMGRLVGESKLELVSESFLGKEPTRYVCAVRVCKAVTNLESCSGNMDITLFDDGC